MMTGDGKNGMWHGNQLFTRNTADMFLGSWSAVMLVNCFAKKVDWIKLSLAVLFSTRSPCFSAQKRHTHTGVRRITVTVKDLQSSTQTCPHEVQEERMPLKLRRTSSSLATKWCRISWKVSKIGFTAMIMCLQDSSSLMHVRTSWAAASWNCAHFSIIACLEDRSV